MSSPQTAILGTGIIGLSTAHYLSLSPSTPPSSIHLIDPSPTLFASASGFAGGFLAEDWFAAPLEELGRLSFRLHRELAEANGGREKWGYLKSRGVSYNAGSKGKKGRGEVWLRQGGSRGDVVGVSEVFGEEGDGPAWLKRGEGDSLESIGEEGSLAQVDPLRLCKFLLQAGLSRGVQLHHPARAISLGKDMRDELSSIRILNTSTNAVSEMPCTRLLISAGAWSPQVFSTLFPEFKLRLPISSLAGHSLVVRSPRWGKQQEEKGCHAIFTTDEAGYSPEIFSRMGEEIYIAGLNSSSLPLPALATESPIDERSVAKLKKTAQRLLGEENTEVMRKGLCFRPVTTRGTPILERIEEKRLGGFGTRGGGEGGVFLAAGHGPWGISNSLGTGKVMSEMIEGQETSVDIRGLGL
ncbi:FAD dependent oxidoreductase-like protein [Hyaloscypha variabilis F]|uniref:FAD dependent oxidoreductase-like protein n=1 Tax=Hyaloscypha variabilis (strain UAMH 11265 / GT02V1 / F) TaxID=1149755 RepID=A0A2J6QWT6_HYAVF|nr:FAD dependent oxidoreductase-like protein [Hyaloscypha variabilis F]